VQTVTAFDNGPRILWDMGRRAPLLNVRTRHGLKLECPNVAGARVPLYELFAEDAYRIGDLTAALRDDLVVLDIGGQIGCFSTALALAVPGATIHAFEASPSTAEFLRRNVATNGFAERVHVHATALSDHVGTLRFASGTLGSGLNGLTSPADASNAVDVPCVTFAEAVAIAGGRVDVVKMDIEGAEYDVVLTSSPDDWATVKRAAVEFHGLPGRHWHELRDFFAKAGLNVTDAEFGTGGYGLLRLSR
jgi:FkbM family methyltransferase